MPKFQFIFNFVHAKSTTLEGVVLLTIARRCELAAPGFDNGEKPLRVHIDGRRTNKLYFCYVRPCDLLPVDHFTMLETPS